MSVESDKDPSLEALEAELPQHPETKTGAQESKEVLPTVSFKVLGPCKDPNGSFVSLNLAQRKLLHPKDMDIETLEQKGLEANVGDVIEVKDGDQLIGVYVIGMGPKGHKELEDCYANGIDKNTQISVQKIDMNKPYENPINLKAKFGLEENSKHQLRADKISRRFEDYDSQKYMVVPTSVAVLLGMPASGAKATIRQISKRTVRIGEKVVDMVMVPAGNDVAFTSKAASEIGIPDSVGSVSVRVDNGTLVIDHVE